MARLPTTTVLTAVLAAGTAAAQLDAELDAPVDSYSFFNQSEAGIQTIIGQGYRLSDIEITATNPLRFTGTAVDNTGPYGAAAWWWVYDKTELELRTTALWYAARLIDVERYEVNGQVRYAAIMVHNVGPGSIQWYFWTEVPYAQMPGLVANAGARVVDVEHHEVNGANRLTLLAIANSGPQQRAWWYYIDYSLPFIQSKVQLNGARLVEIERIDEFRWAGIMVQDDVGPQWTLVDVSAANLKFAETYHLARAFDIEQYLDGGTPKWTALLVDNYENFRPFGTPCDTGDGLLVHDAAGTALIGTATSFEAHDIVPFSSAAALHLGFQQIDVSLGLLGRPECALYVAPVTSLAVLIGGNGDGQALVLFPNDPGIVGLEFVTQMLALDQAAPGFTGLATSNGVRTRVRG